MPQVVRELLIQMTGAIANSGVGYLLLALIIFWALGERCIREAPRLERTGRQIGVASFVLYLAWSYRHHGMPLDSELVSVAFRALLCAGFATSIGWLLLTLGAAVYKHTFGSAAHLFSFSHRRR